MSFLKGLLVAAVMTLPLSAARAETKDIVDVAAGAGTFNTLVTAVKAAGLADTLKGKGPFTVFAPTDAAFAKLPKGTVEDLLKPENKAKLVKILTYHVLPSKVMAADINGKKMNLSSNKTDIGIVDIDKGTTTYRAQLVIPETVEFTASELDQIRVSWSIGFEDYEIFDMDVMRNLFKCLDKK